MLDTLNVPPLSAPVVVNVTLPVPVNVPPDSVSASTFSALLNVAVPPVIVRPECDRVFEVVKVALPLLTFTGPVSVSLPKILILPLAIFNAPPPLKVEALVNVYALP